MGGTAVQLHLHLEVYLLCAGLLVAYVALIRRYGPLFHPRPGDRAVQPGQAVAFVAGVVALWVASASPVHDLAERYLYSAHMVQHLLQAFVIPPLLLLGIPRWMGEVLLRPRWLRAVMQGLSKPLVAAVAFNGVLLVVHWPAVVDGMLASEAFHALSHVALITVGLAMWMNVVSPVPHILPRLAPVVQMFYLFLMTLLPTIPASFLTFGDTPLYQAYAAFPRVWGLDVLDDMRIAGLIMKIGGGFLLWGIITVLFFKWAGAEERAAAAGAAQPTEPTDLPSL